MGQIDRARVADVALQGLLVYARLKLDRSLALVARLPTADAESGGYGIEQPAAGTHRRRIMIDVAMPGLNGIETVKRARQRWPFLRVLDVTGYVDMAGAERRRPAIKKLFKLIDLTNGVRRAINRAPNDADANVVSFGNRR